MGRTMGGFTVKWMSMLYGTVRGRPGLSPYVAWDTCGRSRHKEILRETGGGRTDGHGRARTGTDGHDRHNRHNRHDQHTQSPRTKPKYEATQRERKRGRKAQPGRNQQAQGVTQGTSGGERSSSGATRPRRPRLTAQPRPKRRAPTSGRRPAPNTRGFTGPRYGARAARRNP